MPGQPRIRASGLLNAAIGVHVALQDATPLVVLAGHVETTEIGRRGFQEIDASRVFSGLFKEVRVPRDPRRIAEFVAAPGGSAMPRAEEAWNRRSPPPPATRLSFKDAATKPLHH